MSTANMSCHHYKARYKIFSYSLIAAIAIDSMLPSTYATIGPVIGAVLILCAVIALAMYCYRHNIEPGKRQSIMQKPIKY